MPTQPRPPGLPHAAGHTADAPRIGVISLTQGRRPEDLRTSLESVLAQTDVLLDIVVVGNGWQPAGLPEGVRSLALPENVGIPAGRNAGVAEVTGDLLLFIDDDAHLLDAHFLATAARRFRQMPDLGVLQPRVEADDGSAPTRWIPRIRKGSAMTSSPVVSLWEGVLVVRRSAFEQSGGWGAPYFYAHEGIELAWRVWDAGYTVWYMGDLRCSHPAIDPTRHAEFHVNQARNRVWLARRNLRWPFSWIYVCAWTGVTLARAARPAGERDGVRPYLRGLAIGLREDPGGRRPMRWSTVARMTRLARPPFI